VDHDHDADDHAIAASLVAAQAAVLAGQALLRRRRNWPTPPRLRLAAAVAGVAALAVLAGAGRSLGPGLTASPLPHERAQLRTDGPYRFVRHPIYSAVLVLSAARTAESGDRRQVVLTAALAGVLVVKAAFEERALIRRFPEYQLYLVRTPRFVPRLGRAA
jgi:protein-S-isoprenylcysteine O-methyltransferase Ste14